MDREQKTLKEITAEIQPVVPLKTVWRWVKDLKIGSVIDGRIHISKEEILALGAFGWLRYGTSVKIREAKTVVKKALRKIRKGERKVAIALRGNPNLTPRQYISGIKKTKLKAEVVGDSDITPSSVLFFLK